MMLSPPRQQPTVAERDERSGVLQSVIFDARKLSTYVKCEHAPFFVPKRKRSSNKKVMPVISCLMCGKMQ